MALPKYIRNTGKIWTSQEIKKLAALAKSNTPTRVIGLLLGRTEDSIRNMASQSDISLKPTNQSPYSSRVKK